VKGVEEVVIGLTPEEAHEEACRCLRCDVKAVGGR
jgi:NADPH-dependent glutamate synthase beta subunit-like oxidoreductase